MEVESPEQIVGFKEFAVTVGPGLIVIVKFAISVIQVPPAGIVFVTI